MLLDEKITIIKILFRERHSQKTFFRCISHYDTGVSGYQSHGSQNGIYHTVVFWSHYGETDT